MIGPACFLTNCATPMTYLFPSLDSVVASSIAKVELLTGCPAKGNSSPVSVKISSVRGCPGPGASCKKQVSEYLNSLAISDLRV